MATLTQEPISSGQKKQLTRMISDVADSDGVQVALDALSKEGAERLKGDPEFVASVQKFVVEQIGKLSVTNQFAGEEILSKYGYLSGYKPRDLQAQIALLHELFPELRTSQPGLLTQIVEGEIRLPQNAEGWFAIPNWVKNPAIFGQTYGEAVQKVLDKIKQTRGGKFYNYRENQLGPNQLRQSARTEQFFRNLAEAQGNPDILIVSAQFGLKHAGKSVRRVREVFSANEFGLGAFAVGVMLLTHPERLQHFDDLWIDCAGDEFAPDAAGKFSDAPYFIFNDGGVEFDAYDVSIASESDGSASGFSPQE